MNEDQSASSASDGRGAQLRESQLMLMHAIDQIILDHSNTLAETLQLIVDEARQILNAQHVDILFLYPDGLRVEISATDGDVGRFVPFDESISGLVLSQGEPVLVNDIRSDPQLRDRYYPRKGSYLGTATPRLSVISAKLTLDDETIGVINVEAAPDNNYDESHLSFVNAMARQISVAISHAALFDEDHLRTATDGLLIAGTGDSDVIMRQVLDRILNARRRLQHE
jgi:GAF domain-containing protein